MSSENHHVDEFLNGLIDEELTATEETELRKLLDRDKKLAARLEQLAACRTLVSSLPKAKVPADLADRVRQTLERRSLLGEVTTVSTERAFAGHLFARKVVAAAAAVVLVGVLSVLVYSILSPSGASHQPFVVHEVTSSGGPSAQGSQQLCSLTGRLVVRVASLADMEMFFNRALEDNGLATPVEKDGSEGRRIYRLQCSHATLERLLSDLSGVWNRFDNPTFYLETARLPGPVRVASVKPEQLALIARQKDARGCAEVAREIAVRNSALEALSGEGVLARMTRQDKTAWLDVAKPVLTSSERPAQDRAQQSSGPRLINLTVVLDSQR